MSEDAQSCPTLCNPMDCSLPGSSVGIRKETIIIRGEINKKEMKEIIAKGNKTKSILFEKIKFTNL